jgi:hypothetical protein
MVTSIPQATWRQAQGNPLAAGLIAFEAGWLVSSVLPLGRKERELATRPRRGESAGAAPPKAQSDTPRDGAEPAKARAAGC